MIPVLAAAFAKPAIRYGVMGGVALLLVGSIWWHGYTKGKATIQQAWDAAIAQQAATIAHEVVKADQMEATVVKANDQAERVIEAKAEQIKKEVVRHAKRNSKPLDTTTLDIYDRLIRLPNEAGHSLSSPDPRAGASEIPRGGVAVETTTGLQDEDGTTIELTTEELAQAAVDFAEKYALMKNAYKGLSDWNEGRERLELDRLPQE